MEVERKPHIPVQVPGAKGCRPDLPFRNWEEGKDLLVDVAGCSPLCVSNVHGFIVGGAALKAVARKKASYRHILLAMAQPPSVAYKTFAFEALGGLHRDACDILPAFKGY